MDAAAGELSGVHGYAAGGPGQILDAVESFLSPGASGAPPRSAVVAIGGSADTNDVTRHLTAGRQALAADGRALVLYDDPAAAARDVAGYLRPRALTMVRFGLHVGELPGGDGRLSGPVVAAASRLADLAGPGRLRISAGAAELLGDTVPMEMAEDGSYQMRRS